MLCDKYIYIIGNKYIYYRLSRKEHILIVVYLLLQNL